ncbi:hypothetical protein B0J12DRAFT_188400 [Macrophomina phaseolina]|uniref:Uncharacterized protein n=1 Tax=Macrophomina phaseolina TaxID=35725 RepID=A0ABQ8G3Z0_9PEZI|nr:hypothetical protein B0J12DRAFT_188400 [Macrophomina phaseolina]
MPSVHASRSPSACRPTAQAEGATAPLSIRAGKGNLVGPEVRLASYNVPARPKRARDRRIRARNRQWPFAQFASSLPGRYLNGPCRLFHVLPPLHRVSFHLSGQPCPRTRTCASRASMSGRSLLPLLQQPPYRARPCRLVLSTHVALDLACFPSLAIVGCISTLHIILALRWSALALKRGELPSIMIAWKSRSPALLRLTSRPLAPLLHWPKSRHNGAILTPIRSYVESSGSRYRRGDGGRAEKLPASKGRAFCLSPLRWRPAFCAINRIRTECIMSASLLHAS